MYSFIKIWPDIFYCNGLLCKTLGIVFTPTIMHRYEIRTTDSCNSLTLYLHYMLASLFMRSLSTYIIYNIIVYIIYLYFLFLSCAYIFYFPYRIGTVSEIRSKSDFDRFRIGIKWVSKTIVFIISRCFRYALGV